MPIHRRPPSSWPAVLAALALFLVGTGAIALHRGWISSQSLGSVRRILLTIRSEFSGRPSDDIATPDGELGANDEPGPRDDDTLAELPLDLSDSPLESAPPAPRRSVPRPRPAPPAQRAVPAAREVDPFEERRRLLRDRHTDESAGVVAALAEEEATLEEPVVERAPRRKPPMTIPEEAGEDLPLERPAAPPVSKSPASKSATPKSVNATPREPRESPDSPIAATPVSSSQALDLAAVEKLIEEERDVQALQELTKWYWKTPSKRDELRPRMEELSQRIYFSQQPHYFEPHVVANNEQLRTIARDYQLTWEYLARLNRTDPKRIRPGQRLKVVPGPFHVLVNIRSHELIVHNNGCFVKRYEIGAGKDRSTPIGVFPVKTKLVNPTYYPPEGGIVKASDPANPLGTRWIDIGDSYGIHGTNEPDTIGKDLSRGCVRMRNDEVTEVYDFLVIGSEVRIQR